MYYCHGNILNMLILPIWSCDLTTFEIKRKIYAVMATRYIKDISKITVVATKYIL